MLTFSVKMHKIFQTRCGRGRPLPFFSELKQNWLQFVTFVFAGEKIVEVFFRIWEGRGKILVLNGGDIGTEAGQGRTGREGNREENNPFCFAVRLMRFLMRFCSTITLDALRIAYRSIRARMV